MTEYDFHDSMIQVEMIFQSHILSFGYKEYSLETYVDKGAFQSWKANEDCADTDEMRAGLNINGILRSDDPSGIEVLTYLQYVLNIAELARRRFNREEEPGYQFDIRIYTELLAKVRELLRVLNYEIRYSKKREFLFLLPYDPAADAIGEDEGDPLANAVTEYRSALALPDPAQKRGLLVKLGEEIERLPDNLSPENAYLYSRIEFLLNRVRIREEEDVGDAPERIEKMSDAELSEWYDRTYQLMLLRILNSKSGEQLDEVNRLAEECGIEIETVTKEEIESLLGTIDAEAEAPVPSWAVPDEEEIARRKEERRKRRAVPEDDEEEEQMPLVKKSAFDLRKVIWTVIIADLIFAVFLLIYFFLM